MNEEWEHLQQLNSLPIQLGEQNLKIHSFIELAKHITDSPHCEINIIDTGYQEILAGSEANVKVIPRNDSICLDTIRKKDAYEVEDLANDKRYHEHAYVIDATRYRYYFGVKLKTSKSINIGSICVLDTKPKRISNKQKEKFKLLANLVVHAIETEYQHNSISSEIDTLKNSLHKLNHDVRNPISGIIGMADLLIEHKEHKEALTQDIIMIKESAETIIDIINGVLAASDANKNIERLKDKVAFSNVLKKIKRLYDPSAQNKNLSLSFTNQNINGIEVPYYFSINLLQIIGNLVSNAVKFTPYNGFVKVIAGISAEGNRNLLNITVEDNGKSMPSDQISAFNNGKPIARSIGTNGEKSFGIGLQHVIKLVSEEGGSIFVKPARDKGTNFSISLPLPVDSKNARQ